jgi:tetratricopeptide (TPR) repeat protein
VNHCQFATQPDTAILESISLALEQEPHCKKNQAFLFGLGQKFNQTRQYSEAVDRLEAAILLDPNHWEAHLEFAIALEGMGDTSVTASAQPARNRRNSLFPKAPNQNNRKRQPHQVTAKRTVSAVAGYDDNLMGATHVSSFDLTLPLVAYRSGWETTTDPKEGTSYA